MRSVNLERDFSDPRSSEGYIITPMAEKAFERICGGFSNNSTQRAFRIGGDYGSGKSAFALALARVAAGYTRALPKGLRKFCGRTRLFPRLATGDHEPLANTILRALGVRLAPTARASTSEVLSRVNKALARARGQGFNGILLVLDELGKNLEYAAQHPESDDVFLLQRLAEEAARSGKQPLVIVAMLHQGIAAYAADLDSAARREWDKVAGRFDEVVYAQPLEQLTGLLAATLNTNVDVLPSSVKEAAQKSMKAAVTAGVFGASVAGSLVSLGPRIYPLHPTVVPLLAKAIRKFGQNERSLFSFISSDEPMGLQQHVRKKQTAVDPYRIFHLFDYVRHNLLPSLNSGMAASHWGIVDSILSSTRFDSQDEEHVLKSVALLNLLDAPDLPATEDFLHLALDTGANRHALHRAIREIKRRGLLYERGTSRGLCLWPKTSVNLDDAYRNAVSATRQVGDGIELLCQHLPAEHLVPRGHYLRTGTLRYAEVGYAPAAGLSKFLSSQPAIGDKQADLNLRVFLPASQRELRETEDYLRKNRGGIAEGVFIAVAQPPVASLAALSDLRAWSWVIENTQSLSGDRFAREEATRQHARAERLFRERLNGLDNLSLPSGVRLNWFYGNGEIRLNSGRPLLSFLSEQCDRIFHRAPHVVNELINRRFPSSAAVAARTKLVEAMAAEPGKALLGMDPSKRPPELALYLSILKGGRFHVQGACGWRFELPSPKRDSCNLRPSLAQITSVVQEHGTDALVPVPTVLEALSKAPFGVRDGLKPFILALYFATHHQRVALYEDGTYVPEVGGAILARLMKEPQFFHVQYCELSGVRAETFSRLLDLLEIPARDADRADLIDLVRPLTVFISRELPDYSRKTGKLSVQTLAVRQALLDAREPIRLVFTLLPEACGLSRIDKIAKHTAHEFASRLRAALHELRTAYPELLNRMKGALWAAFGIDPAEDKGRATIAKRAAQLASIVTEPTLKALALRLADTALGERAWIESIGNLMARKSPERWIDNDESEFLYQLEIAVGRFKRTELALIGTTHQLNGRACRIAITKSNGIEVGDLVNWEGMDEDQIRPLESQIQKILCQHGRNGVAAAMRALWTQLNPNEELDEV